jgi:hypothetical protein
VDLEFRLVTCDIGAVTAPDLATLDAVARLALAARRVGVRIELRNPCSPLRELLDLAGLSDLVTVAGVQVRDRGGVVVRRSERACRCRGRS